MSKFNGRTATADDVQTRLRQLGVDFTVERHMEPPRPEVNKELAWKERVRAAKVARANKEKAEALAKGAIDARTATAEEVADRVRELGLDDGAARLFRQHAEAPPLGERHEPPSPEHARAEAERAARKRVEGLWLISQFKGEKMPVKSLSPEEYRQYLKMVGLDPGAASSVPTFEVIE